MESKFASMIPEDFGGSQSNLKDSSTDKKSDFSQDSGADDEENISTSEAESLEDELKSMNSENPVKRVSKSESFSHNSEFDIAKMKRKKFSSGSAAKADAKRGHSNIDLRRSSNHSSSEEEISIPFSSQKEIEKSRNLGRSSRSTSNNSNNKINDHRATSMHNLTSGDSVQQSKKMERNRLAANEKSQIQKTTSLLEISNGASLTDASSGAADNMMMDAFRNQLEAQFEQWKTEFLKEHIMVSSADLVKPDSPGHSASLAKVIPLR
jgi:hypothetical protein